MPSTIIRAIAFQDGRLEVSFITGRCYVYEEVPADVAEAFRTARIKGRHFNAHIRGRYAFRELKAAPARVRSGTPAA